MRTEKTYSLAPQVFMGDDAFDEFNRFLKPLLLDTMTGEILVMVREGFALEARKTDAYDIAKGLPDGSEMVIIDCGTLGGDAWKVIYHPEKKVCVVIVEAVSVDGGLNVFYPVSSED